jgi:hypothetical protein
VRKEGWIVEEEEEEEAAVRICHCRSFLTSFLSLPSLESIKEICKDKKVQLEGDREEQGERERKKKAREKERARQRIPNIAQNGVEIGTRKQILPPSLA